MDYESVVFYSPSVGDSMDAIVPNVAAGEPGSSNQTVSMELVPAPTHAAAAAAADAYVPSELGGEELNVWRMPLFQHPVYLKSREEFVAGIVRVLSEWLNSHEGVSAPRSIFNGAARVPFSEFIDTLHQFVEYVRSGREILISCCVYVQRIHASEFFVTWQNVYRLLLAGVLVGVKLFDDFGLRNRKYSRLIGLEISDICAMELGLCRLLSYDLFISEEEFAGVASQI